MKTMIYTLLLSSLMLSCSSSASEKTTENKLVETTVVETAVAKSPTQSTSVTDYMALKDALVKSDAATAKTAAAALSASLKAEKMDDKLAVAADLIAGTSDLKAQRAAFKTVTDGMIVALKAKGNQSVYVQYCPMAFNNTGANWLSLSEEIRNPYFGDMMLKCGRVTEKL